MVLTSRAVLNPFLFQQLHEFFGPVSLSSAGVLVPSQQQHSSVIHQHHGDNTGQDTLNHALLLQQQQQSQQQQNRQREQRSSAESVGVFFGIFIDRK